MAASLFFINDDDRKLLQNVIDRERRLNRAVTGQLLRNPPVQELGQSPEVYIGVPQTTIPAMQPSGTGTGREPGYGLVDLYRVLIDEDGDQKLFKVGFDKPCVNIGDTDVTSWTPIWRDKWGQWLCFGKAGGTGSANIAIVNTQPNGSPIPARSGLLVQSGLCSVWKIIGEGTAGFGNLSGPLEYINVYNLATEAIPYNVFIIAWQEFESSQWIAGFPGLGNVVTGLSCVGGTFTATVADYGLGGE